MDNINLAISRDARNMFVWVSFGVPCFSRTSFLEPPPLLEKGGSRLRPSRAHCCPLFLLRHARGWPTDAASEEVPLLSQEAPGLGALCFCLPSCLLFLRLCACNALEISRSQTHAKKASDSSCLRPESLRWP